METARTIGAELFGPDEAAADRRLRAELDNLRAARDLARRRDELDTCVDITLAVDQASIWRDLRELWAWCLELADDPAIAGHPREVDVLVGAADAARLTGDFDLCLAVAERALATETSSAQAPQLVARATSSLAAVAHFRGDFARAALLWGRSGEVEDPKRQIGYLASSALAAAYDGDLAGARSAIARAWAGDAIGLCTSPRAFARYVDGEIVAGADPESAIASYTRAIEGSRSVGANFVEGVASVALASAPDPDGRPRRRRGAVRSPARLLGRNGTPAPALDHREERRAAARLARQHP